MTSKICPGLGRALCFRQKQQAQARDTDHTSSAKSHPFWSKGNVPAHIFQYLEATDLARVATVAKALHPNIFMGLRKQLTSREHIEFSHLGDFSWTYTKSIYSGRFKKYGLYNKSVETIYLAQHARVRCLRHLLSSTGKQWVSDPQFVARFLPALRSITFTTGPVNNEDQAAPAYFNGEVRQILLAGTSAEKWEAVNADRATTEENLLLLAQRCHSLKSVTLEGANITGRVIVAFAKYCPDLEVMKLYSSFGTDEAFAALFRSCKKLQQIYLSNLRNVTDRLIDSAIEYCAKGTRVEFVRCPTLNYPAEDRVTELSRESPHTLLPRQWHFIV